MKAHVLSALLLSLLAAVTRPGFAQTSGQITYEVVRKIDQSAMRIVINGEQVKPGDPNFPTDLPDTRSYSQKLVFSGDYGREDREEQNAVVRTVMEFGGSGAPRTTNMGRPFEEQVYLDFAKRKTITLLTIGKDQAARTYRSEVPIGPANGWQLTDQTRKIAGYSCRKALVPYRKETYAVWFTTDLPLTYSPLHELMPEKGVVLLIEGGREQFKATNVKATATPAIEVQPSTSAQSVSPEQLTEVRQKAMADFRQKIMNDERN